MTGLRWALLAAALLLTSGAWAQNTSESQPQAEPEPEVIKVYDKNTLTPDNIRACLKTDQDINAFETQLADYQATLADFRKQIEDLVADLDKRRKQIDGTDPKAVDAYNKRVDRHRGMIDRYNSQFLPTLAERRKKLNDAIDFYNANCADKAYFEEDWLAAVAEMGIEDPRAQTGGGK